MEENKFFQYLDRIHAESVLNKFELAPLLMGNFPDLNKQEAYDILEQWILKRLKADVN